MASLCWPAEKLRARPELQPSTHSAILALFGGELGRKLLPVFAARKHVAAEPRVALADVVNKRALFLLLTCLNHTLRAVCCGSIKSARVRARAPGCGPAEFAECVVESNPLYAYLAHAAGGQRAQPAGQRRRALARGLRVCERADGILPGPGARGQRGRGALLVP